MSISFSPSSPVLVGGGRAASPRALAAAGRFARALVSGGYRLHVGCAAGIDAAALCGALALGGRYSSLFPHLHAFSAFDEQGQGSWRSSAVQVVMAAARAGALVHWLAGGGLSVPLVARLMSRSIAALAGCGLAVFFHPGPGSLKVARAALKAGIPVLVWRIGWPAPPVLAVAAVPVSFLGFSFWLFQPATQSALF